MLDKLKDLCSKNWKQYAVWLTICGALWVLYATGYMPGFNPPSPPIPIFETAQGWVRDDAAVEQVSSTLRFKVFADTPAGNVANIPDHFYQWDIVRKINPAGPPAKNQNPVGSCVSFGTNSAIYRTMAGQIVLGNANEELKDIAEEVTYAGSRVEIGGGRIRGDGSVGAWAAQFVQKWGVVAREKHGQYDLTSYDPTRCRAWGQSGVPADLETVAKLHPVKDITRITSWDEAKKALAQGYGIAICSDQGFSMQRDARGIARASGSWAHCMCLDGYHTEGGREYGHIENSWGASAHTGPVGWGNPSTAGFWADSSVIDWMIRSGGDTWAFSGVKGFPARDSEWFVQLPAARTVRVASLKLERVNPCVLYSLSP